MLAHGCPNTAKSNEASQQLSKTIIMATNLQGNKLSLLHFFVANTHLLFLGNHLLLYSKHQIIPSTKKQQIFISLQRTVPEISIRDSNE